MRRNGASTSRSPIPVHQPSATQGKVASREAGCARVTGFSTPGAGQSYAPPFVAEPSLVHVAAQGHAKMQSPPLPLR